MKDPYRCVSCGRSFDSEKELVEHNREHHGGQDPPRTTEQSEKSAEQSE